MLNAEPACLYRPDKPGPGAMGAAVMWDGCGPQFVLDRLDGHTKDDAIAAARDAAMYVATRR
jgi:hypothetical protein